MTYDQFIEHCSQYVRDWAKPTCYSYEASPWHEGKFIVWQFDPDKIEGNGLLDDLTEEQAKYLVQSLQLASARQAEDIMGMVVEPLVNMLKEMRGRAIAYSSEQIQRHPMHRVRFPVLHEKIADKMATTKADKDICQYLPWQLADADQLGRMNL